MLRAAAIVVRDLIKRFRIRGAMATFVALALPGLEIYGGEAVAVDAPGGRHQLLTYDSSYIHPDSPS